MRATEFMHDSNLRMDEDHVGKQQDLYLWCSVGGGKNWGLWGCPMRFTSGCPCAICITETRNYLILQFHGHHNPGCHSRPMMCGRNSGPSLGGFKSYYSSGGDSETVQSGMSLPDFTFSTFPSPSSHRADGDHCEVRRAASNVAYNIMHASVMGSPVMDELRRQGAQQCNDGRALLGYSSYDSDDDDSRDSFKRRAQPSTVASPSGNSAIWRRRGFQKTTA
jgi:hypothetical protein